MAFRIEISREAAIEIEAAVDHLVSHSPQGGERWLSGLLACVETLGHNPQRCPLSPEAERTGSDVRQLLYGKRQHKYRISFTIAGDVVTIRNVRHAARRWLDE